MGKEEKRINIMRPEVSVVIITYNQENYITNCVDSVIHQQTCRQMEILIGDDASDDGTGDILSKYAKQYPELIRLFWRSRNMGASANLKDLVERASGSYIAFCEGDDFWISDQKLERQIRYLEQHPDCSGCVHDTLLVDQYGNALRNQKLQWVNHKSVFSLDDFSLAKFPGHLSSLMLRNDTKWKSLNKSVLLCDRNKSDRMLFLMVLSMGNIGYIPGRMSAYRFVRSSDGHNLISAMYNSKQVTA